MRGHLWIGALLTMTACYRPAPTHYYDDPGPPPAAESIALPPSAPPGEEPTQAKFEAALSAHGRWIDTPEYGRVWIPTVEGDWRPYSFGEWSYTDYGWAFVSYDPWGWAPFHYGRWAYLSGSGWGWIPGYVWSPAWVSWRYGGGYVCWAPLGPTGVTRTYYSTPSLWMAVRAPGFGGPVQRAALIPTQSIGNILRTTYFSGIPSGRAYFSPPARYIARLSGRTVYRIPARAVAPRWVKRGVRYRPRVRLRMARRQRRMVARAVRRRRKAARRRKRRVRRAVRRRTRNRRIRRTPRRFR